MIRPVSPFKVAVAQAGSVLFDREGSTEKAIALIRRAGGQGRGWCFCPRRSFPVIRAGSVSA